MATQSTKPTSWRLLLELVAPGLAIGGIIVYGLVVITYRQFYGNLGVEPEAVGLGYASLLGNAVGLVIVAALFLPVLLFLDYLPDAIAMKYANGVDAVL
jgi:hypothetical protein